MPSVSKLCDRFARCEECGTEFVYTPAEQRQAQAEGSGTGLPRLCAGCRALDRRMRARQMTGTVKWFDRRKGFGFLVSDAGDAIFMHRSALAEGTPAPRRGQRVEYQTRPGEKGLEAIAVRLVAPCEPAVGSDEEIAEAEIGRPDPLQGTDGGRQNE